MMLSKNVNNKRCAPKLIFFNEKKIEKDSDNFWYRKLTLKVKRLGDFALFDTSPLSQFSKFNNFLWVCLKTPQPYCHNVCQFYTKEHDYHKLMHPSFKCLLEDSATKNKKLITSFFTHPEPQNPEATGVHYHEYKKFN